MLYFLLTKQPGFLIKQESGLGIYKYTQFISVVKTRCLAISFYVKNCTIFDV